LTFSRVVEVNRVNGAAFVPEAASLTLFGLGATALGLAHRRVRSKRARALVTIPATERFTICRHS
jgi:hypothetical protein